MEFCWCFTILPNLKKQKKMLKNVPLKQIGRLNHLKWIKTIFLAPVLLLLWFLLLLMVLETHLWFFEYNVFYTLRGQKVIDDEINDHQKCWCTVWELYRRSKSRQAKMIYRKLAKCNIKIEHNRSEADWLYGQTGQ